MKNLKVIRELRHRSQILSAVSVVLFLSSLTETGNSQDAAKDPDAVFYQLFKDPPAEFRGIRWGGIYIGAVLMNTDTYERKDMSKSLVGISLIQCKIPKGDWKLMGFWLNSEFRPNSQKGGFVDYLSKEAVAKYLALNFEPYYAHLKEYFGTVIKRTIYDEPAMHLSDGRMWTQSFNAEFEKRYHFSPMIYYPALWYYIGPETSAARNALYDFRADLAVVYPIAALQSAYSFSGPPTASRMGSAPDMYYAYEGGIVPSEIDYMNLGETLYRSLRIDYTYLHPDVLTEKCTVIQQKIRLNNKENYEDYRVLILPGGDTFSAEVAKKVLEFYRNGGTIIATSMLPVKSAEFNRDKELSDIITEIFGISDEKPMAAEITIVTDDFTSFFKNSNKSGGRGYFVPQPYYNILAAILKEVIPVKDVDIQSPPVWPVKMNTAYDGALTYLHKVKDNRDIYYFSNSTDNPVSTTVAFRGDKNLELWNPHTGERQSVELKKENVSGEVVTIAKLNLDPVSAIFFVGN